MTEKSRDVIVVDTETTGLGLNAVVLEVAAVNLATGEELYFAPHVNSEAFGENAYEALRINRYFERGVYRHMEPSPAATRSKYQALADMLRGNTFAGSNPAFDVGVLPPWVTADRHYRLLDLAAYAAGVLGIEPNNTPGLHAVCERLGVVNEESHGALGDARATAECFRRLIECRGKSILLNWCPDGK